MSSSIMRFPYFTISVATLSFVVITGNSDDSISITLFGQRSKNLRESHTSHEELQSGKHSLLILPRDCIGLGEIYSGFKK